MKALLARLAAAKRLRIVIGFTLGIAGLGFVFQRMLSDRAALAAATPSPPRIALSVAVLLFSLAMSITVWRRIIRLMGHPQPAFSRLVSIFFISGTARYVPGMVWRMVTAAALAQHAALDARTLVASMLVHSGMSLVAALVLGALALPLVFGASTVLLAAAPALAVLALVLVHPRVIGTALRFASPLLGGQRAAWLANWPAGTITAFMALAGWLAYGSAFFLLVTSFTPLAAARLPLIIGITAVAFLAGQAAVIVPAGLGVRELALAALLEPLVGAGLAALIAVAARFWIAGAELIGVVLSLAMNRLTQRPGVDSSVRSHDSSTE